MGKRGMQKGEGGEGKGREKRWEWGEEGGGKEEEEDEELCVQNKSSISHFFKLNLLITHTATMPLLF